MNRESDRARDFAGKAVLVTGGAAGLGRAYVRLFGDRGAHVMLADIDAGGMEETRTLVEFAGSSAECHVCDMRKEADIRALGAAVTAGHEKLDVLINNAGLHTGEIARGFFGLGMDKWQYFYAGDEGSFINNEVILCDGGNQMRGFRI